MCGSDVRIEPSDPAGDAACPVCGHLIWFQWDDFGDEQVITIRGNLLRPETLDTLNDSADVQPGTRLVLDFSEVEDISSIALAKLLKGGNRSATNRGLLKCSGQVGYELADFVDDLGARAVDRLRQSAHDGAADDQAISHRR
jgi:hypothetical protein